MKEYFIVANSFAAPFVSDQSTHFQEGESPEDALTRFARTYRHPAGLYAANAYESADSYHKNGPIVAKWRSNQASAIAKATEGKGSYSLQSNSPGVFSVDGERHSIENPKGGSLETTR